MTNMMLRDSTLESLTPSVKAPLVFTYTYSLSYVGSVVSKYQPTTWWITTILVKMDEVDDHLHTLV
jgi:hypothetical protein